VYGIVTLDRHFLEIYDSGFAKSGLPNNVGAGRHLDFAHIKRKCGRKFHTIADLPESGITENKKSDPILTIIFPSILINCFEGVLMLVLLVEGVSATAFISDRRHFDPQACMS